MIQTESVSTEITFGEWLKHRRHLLDLTQQELANKVGCARITLRRIESNALKPSKELAIIILEKIGIPELERPRWIPFARGLSSIPSELLSTSTSRLTNLPIRISNFIGREYEQDTVKNLLANKRLVTLTGSGGVGKTGLALQTSHQVLNQYAYGVWLITLDALTDSHLLPQAVAFIFDIKESNNKSIIDSLIQMLSTKSLLLIFDNCEHILEACTKLTTILLEQCPHLKILATSREALGVDGEALYRVPSLPVPSFELTENANNYESIRLFSERAQLVETNFSITKENLSSIIQICKCLDGIPLAIELAAAHVDIFQVDEIYRQLQVCFDLLTNNKRNVIERHQTMRASVDWSWNLLTQPEQTFMSQLSIFAGGWTLESAKAVCTGDVLRLTNALVRKSLIIVQQETRHETRYRFHEVIRQYAREKLAETGEAEVSSRHLNHFLQLSEQAENELKGHAQMEWRARLNTERDNIRTALAYASKTNIEAGLYIAGMLDLFWMTFDIREGMRWLDEFLQKPESKTYSLARAKALVAHGWAYHIFQNFASEHSAAQEALEIYQTHNHKPGEVDALTLLASALHVEGISDMKVFEQALTLSQEIDDAWRQALVLDRMSFAEAEYQPRIYHLKKALKLYRKAGDFRYVASCLSLLVQLQALVGEFDASEQHFKEMTELNQQLGIDISMGTAATISRIESMKGNFERGRVLLEERIAAYKDQSNRMSYLWACAHLGYLFSWQGEINKAHKLLSQTTQEFYADKSDIGVAFVLEALAGVYLAENHFEYAARVIGWADATRKRVRDHRPPLEQSDIDKIITGCLANINEEIFSDEYDKGAKMSLAEIVAYVLNGKK